MNKESLFEQDKTEADNQAVSIKDILIKYINYSIKIIISHSRDNDVIPYSEGKKLFDAIPREHPNSKFIDIVGKHEGIGLTNNYVYSISDTLQD